MPRRPAIRHRLQVSLGRLVVVVVAVAVGSLEVLIKISSKASSSSRVLISAVPMAHQISRTAGNLTMDNSVTGQCINLLRVTMVRRKIFRHQHSSSNSNNNKGLKVIPNQDTKCSKAISSNSNRVLVALAQVLTPLTWVNRGDRFIHNSKAAGKVRRQLKMHSQRNRTGMAEAPNTVALLGGSQLHTLAEQASGQSDLCHLHRSLVRTKSISEVLET